MLHRLLQRLQQLTPPRPLRRHTEKLLQRQHSPQQQKLLLQTHMMLMLMLLTGLSWHLWDTKINEMKGYYSRTSINVSQANQPCYRDKLLTLWLNYTHKSQSNRTETKNANGRRNGFGGLTLTVTTNFERRLFRGQTQPVL